MWKIPRESELHSHTWMAWPWNADVWNHIPGTDLIKAQETIERLVQLISKYEPVSLLVPHDKCRELEHRFKLGDQRRFKIKIIAADYNDIWVRDTLPTFAVSNSNRLIAIDWKFNGWGRRTHQYGKDTELSRKVAALTGALIVTSGVTAEGGAFVFDGDGLLVATKSVMFDKNRNRRGDKDALEKALMDASCCSSICWLPGDRNESITTGHADSILAFADKNIVLFHWVADKTSPEFDVCDYNLRIFEEWAAEQRRQYEVVRLEAPNHQYGDGCCSSYVNFAHVNGAVIVPKLGEGFDKADLRARDDISAAFGGQLHVEMLDVQAIAVAGGGIHCATRHEPLVTPVGLASARHE